MNLSRLVYYSERNPSVSLDMRSLMAACHRNNAASNITGILHYNGRQFLQVLEGGRAEVSAIYHRIAADPRHFNIILIDCSEARERLFPTWAMGLHESSDDKSKDIFLRYFASNEVNPETVNVHSLLDLLQDFSAETQ
ncbi:MAG: BLUF domain-containing protein [Pseudomonadota bacterium]